MRRVLLVITLLVAAGQGVYGAVQYEFRQTTHSDLESMPGTDMTGRGVIDGDRSRVDFLSGNEFPTGSYVFTVNGNRTLTFVDPAKKTYVEVNAAGVASAIGTAQITISKKKVKVAQLDDHLIIAGLPTDHYQLTIDYDITLAFGSIPLTQSVHETVDKWVTMALGDVEQDFLASGAVKTGNPELDELVDTENTKIKGFPLRQATTISTTMHRENVEGSKLSQVFRPTRTQTRELTITSIDARAAVRADLFSVPASYHKPDPLKDDSQKAPLQILTLQPSGSGQ
jgi:hypothetical protein